MDSLEIDSKAEKFSKCNCVVWKCVVGNLASRQAVWKPPPASLAWSLNFSLEPRTTTTKQTGPETTCLSTEEAQRRATTDEAKNQQTPPASALKGAPRSRD